MTWKASSVRPFMSTTSPSASSRKKRRNDIHHRGLSGSFQLPDNKIRVGISCTAKGNRHWNDDVES